MKKICIVTWLGTGNFGTSLQSYALHRKLEEMGYDVCVLSYFNYSDFTVLTKIKKFLRYPIQYAKNILKRLFFESINQRKIRLFNRFNYNICYIFSKYQYKKLIHNTDVFITGSDQIWNCYHSYDPFYFLSFAGHVKRVAYASSIGTNDFPKDKEKKIKVLLSQFKHIGVREKTAVLLLRKLLNRSDIKQVVDPTFLLDENHWQNFANKANIDIEIPKKYILCYFVGRESYNEKQVEDVKQKFGINNIIIITALENKNINISNGIVYNNAGPYEFVNLISHATCVCTDSFHATAISIIMRKDFIEFLRFKDDDKRSQNSRIYDVLKHYGLMDRLYKTYDESLFDSIDYTEITKKIMLDREECLEFLKNSIEL